MRGPRNVSPTVYRLASAHFVSDAYSNLYAPLLPALIPRLGLSLTAAGTMAMLFQLAASVSQLGFGHLADRWRPRVLLVAGPLVSVTVLSLIGTAGTPATLAAILVVGGLGGAAFVDIGNVYGEPTSIDLGQLRTGMGFGIRWNSPVGPLRVDLGWKLTRHRFQNGEREPGFAPYITIGQAF